MTSEVDKVNSINRLLGLTHSAMTLGMWELLEESTSALSNIIGGQILGVVEAQVDFDATQYSPDELVNELGRIFIEEFGFASEFKVENSEKSIRVLFINAINCREYEILKDIGVKNLFSHPVLCTYIAGLKKLGIKARGVIEIDMEANNQTLVLDIL